MVEKAIDIITKPTLVGGSAFLLSRFLSNTQGRTITLLGFPMNINVGYVVTVGIVSLAGETLGEFVLPMFLQSGILTEIEKMLLVPSLTAGIFWVFIRFNNFRIIQLEDNIKLLLYSADAQLMDDYIYNIFINPLLEAVEN